MTLDSDPIYKLDLPNNKLKSFATDVSSASIVQNKELDLIVNSDKFKSSQRTETEFREPASSCESKPSTSGHNLPQNYNSESSLEDFPDTPDVAIKVVTHELEHVHESNHAADNKVKSSDDHQSIAVRKCKNYYIFQLQCYLK